MNGMKLAHLLSEYTLKLRGPFCTSIFTSKFLATFLNVHTRGNQHLSLVCYVS